MRRPAVGFLTAMLALGLLGGCNGNDKSGDDTPTPQEEPAVPQEQQDS